tara:strand:+ start:1212 stop:1634 length:423 start_codon:yes stop_codon:yes gene_type:complete
MFSQAAIYLRDVLDLTQNIRRQPDYSAARQLLQSAVVEVVNDPDQPVALKQLARKQIEQAISYTYSVRPNAPMPPPSMMSTPPISPFAKPSMPYGVMLPPSALTPPGYPQGAEDFSQGAMERRAFRQMVRAALNTVNRGL